ncbi:MAG: hypothetical protein HY594_04110, partial [Candidatus Omnitrophica bacterium]|nr:hypothetical protein [Candidatus Omnitrophota bacterium]
MNKITRFLIVAVLLMAPSMVQAEPPEDHPLLVAAQAAVPGRYHFALEQGARIYLTPDGKSFYLVWDPPQLDIGSALPVIVTLHGHGSWAFDEFALWQPYAELNGYSIVAIQWWFGGGGGG